MNEAKHIDVDISDYAGQDVQLVFRHYDCTDLLVLMLDNIQVVESLDLAISNPNLLEVKLYPNPTSDILKIQGIKQIDKIRIFDMSGNIVKEEKNAEVNVQHLPIGQYIINVYSGKDVISRKFIKK